MSTRGYGLKLCNSGARTQEMLRAEGGGEEQIDDELSAYGPLVPRPGVLVATLMFEIADREHRLQVLSQLGHVEDTLGLSGPGLDLTAEVSGDDDVPRTTPDGKTSAVHFLKFLFSAEQAASFRAADEAVLRCSHPQYVREAPLLPGLLRTLQGEV